MTYMCCVDMFTDDVIRIAVIWSTAAVFCHSTADALVIYTGLSPSLMLLYGYVGVALIMTVGRDIGEDALTRSGSETYRLTVEGAYVALSAVVSIMVCQGKNGRFF